MASTEEFDEEFERIRSAAATLRGKAKGFEEFPQAQQIAILNSIVFDVLKSFVERWGAAFRGHEELIAELWPSVQERVVGIYAEEFELPPEALEKPFHFRGAVPSND